MAFTLPPWASGLRPHQTDAISNITTAFNSGCNLVMLDAPTGSGKTLIGEMVRQSLSVRGLYLCNSISLQHQFAKDFPTAAVIYGRSNYATSTHAKTFPIITAADCNKSKTTFPACSDCTLTNPPPTLTSPHCRWCHPVTACPYEQAKAHAIRSPLTCTNSTYFLYESNYVGNISLGRGLIILDEADTVETVLLNFVTVHISQKQVHEYGLPQPEKKTVESSWVAWAKDVEPIIADYIKSSYCQGNDVESIRRRIRSSRLLQNIRRLNDPYAGIAMGGWVYTGYDKGDISFKPVEVNNLAKTFLWKHCKRWLMMSATTISYQAVADSLGIDEYIVEDVT